MSALSSPTPLRSPGKPGPVALPAPPDKPRRWGVVVGVIVLALILGATFLVLRKPAQQVPAVPVATIKTARAFVAPLNVTLRLSGTTAARNFANITIPILRGPENRGSLVLLDLAKSGSFVKKGDIVAKIDAQSQVDHMEDVKDQVAAAQNDIRKRQAEQKVEWESMQQNLRVTKASFDKAKLDFSASEVKTPVERELLKLAMDESEARYKQQLGDIEFRRKSQTAELRILEITLDRQKRHLQRHVEDIEHCSIHTPMGGLVVMGQVHRGGEMAQIQLGDMVSPGQPIMKVVDPGSMQIQATISQSDSDNLRLAQKAAIGFDAFADMRFSGRVLSIGALAVSGGRLSNYFVRNVPVQVAIEGSDPRLIPDLSAHANVMLETVPDQLQVPLGAVRQQGNRWLVSVKQGQQFVDRQVQPGKRSNTHIAILSGLQAGEEVRID